MRILGIDPGLATVGIGLIEAEHNRYLALDWLTITTKPAPMTGRLLELGNDLNSYIKEMKPDVVVMEKLYFSTNRKTAMDVAHARGALMLTVASHHLPILEPNPMELKNAITGDGRADKKQMQQMITRILKLQEIPTPDDAADALCLAVYGGIFHASRLTNPLPVKRKTAPVVASGK